MRVLRWVLGLPAFFIALIVALSNREFVLISFDPFDPADPVFGLTLPLYALVFGCIVLGMIMGGIAARLSGPKSP